MSEKFNQVMLRRRREANITQRELADRISVSQQAIAQWESGKTLPSRESYQRLVLELGIDPKLFLALMAARDGDQLPGNPG